MYHVNKMESSRKTYDTAKLYFEGKVFVDVAVADLKVPAAYEMTTEATMS